MENWIQVLKQCHQEFLYLHLQAMLLSVLTIFSDCCLPTVAGESFRVSLYLRVTSMEEKLFSKSSSKSHRFEPESVWMILATSNRKLDKTGLLFSHSKKPRDRDQFQLVNSEDQSCQLLCGSLFFSLQSQIVEKTPNITSSYDNVQRQERISPWFVSSFKNAEKLSRSH